MTLLHYVYVIIIKVFDSIIKLISYWKERIMKINMPYWVHQLSLELA